MMTILTLQQYYNEILILQQHSIYNVLNGHCKVPAIFQKRFWQLYKYSGNIARFQWSIFEILPQYYGAMWEVCGHRNYQRLNLSIGQNLDHQVHSSSVLGVVKSADRQFYRSSGLPVVKFAGREVCRLVDFVVWQFYRSKPGPRAAPWALIF